MEKFTGLFKAYKKKLFLLIFIACVLIIFYSLLSNDYMFYHQPIIKVTNSVTESLSSKEGSNGNSETYYTQKITGKVMNGTYKGRTVTFENQYSYSESTTDQYKAGDQLFAEINKGNGSQLTISISNEKRDTQLFFLLAIFLVCLVLVAKKKGFFTFLSLAINLGVFCLCLKFIPPDTLFAGIWLTLVPFFCIVTLLFVAGPNKKTFAAIISTLISVAIIYLMYTGTMYNSSLIPYDMMEYMYTSLPLSNIFMASVILGSLGAIMDVAITITASVSELIATSSHLSIRLLVTSIREISYDIMGTMMNVLFFSYLSSSLPIVILKLNSGYNLGTIYNYDYIFDIVRFLFGSIGIALAIPISGFIAVLILHRKKEMIKC